MFLSSAGWCALWEPCVTGCLVHLSGNVAASSEDAFFWAELPARDFKAEERSPELEGISIWDQ